MMLTMTFDDLNSENIIPLTFVCWCALVHCVCNLKEAMNGLKLLDDLTFMAYVRRSSSHLQCYNVYVDYPPFDMVDSFYWCFDIACVCMFYH